MVGSTHKTIYMPDIAELGCAVPPVGEQRSIVAHIEVVCAELDALSSEAGKVVDLLAERRSALISAAVTGKIDVRSWRPGAVSALSLASLQKLEVERIS